MATRKKAAKKKAVRKRARRDWVVFIDTNVLLDFYRVRGSQDQLSILDHLDGNYDRIITTTQVEMEYMKNRPNAIREGIDAIGSAGQAPQIPAFLSDSKPAKALQTARDRMKDRTEKLRAGRHEHGRAPPSTSTAASPRASTENAPRRVRARLAARS